MQKIYVLRAEDETCTKIGRSGNPNYRCESIILTEKKKYYLLYESHSMEKSEASKIELQIIDKFKDFAIKGKEWLNVHPLEVIRFINTIVKLPNEKTNSVFDWTNYKFDKWIDNNSKFKVAEVFNECIRLGKSYIAYVRLLHNSQFITVGFANIGDAKKFVSKNKHKIEVTKIATNLIYGKDFEQWKNEQINLKHKAEWRLI